MPYKLRKAPKRDLYWVVGEDGKHHSKEPIPKERAQAQMRALYRAERLKGGMDRGLALEPCEGEAHTGETTLTAAEVSELKSMLEDDDADNSTIANVYRTLRPTLNDRLDLNVMDEVKAFLESGAVDRRRTANAINLLLTVLCRVFPRSSGGMKGGYIDRATFEMRKQRMPGYYPESMTYEEYLKGEMGAEEAYKKAKAELDAKNAEYTAAVSRGEIEEEVACKLDSNLDYNRDVVAKSECARRHEERRKKDMTPTQRVFDDINKGLSKVADWSVENVLGNLPVVGQVVGSTYKEFAPPTSKFYKPMGEKGVAERIADAGINVAEIQKKKGQKKDEKKVEGSGVGASTAGLLYDLSAIATMITPYLTTTETEKVDEMYRTYQMMSKQPTAAEAAQKYLITKYQPYLERLAEKYADALGSAAESGFGKSKKQKRKGGNKDKLMVVGTKATLHPKPVRRRRGAIAPPAADAIPLFVPFEAFDTALPPEDYAWERRKDAVMAYDALRKAYGRGNVRRKFKEELKHYGLSPSAYLQRARTAAKKAGYNPKSLTFSDDDDGKLMITDDSGRKVRFGRVGYGDFLLWSAAEKKGKVKSGFAAQKRDTFQKSHSQIKGDWKSDKYSPNSLALAILW
ncbi:hypothetical protein EBZ39_05070 [bacterium]|nr:hypothetical protein [bacterium]